MNYRVSWDPDAFRRLLREWKQAGDPDAGIRAFDALEQILHTEAHLQGESRDSNRRILIVPPLGVIYRARPELAEVLILDAWMIPKRGE